MNRRGFIVSVCSAAAMLGAGIQVSAQEASATGKREFLELRTYTSSSME